jgi:cell division protein FtsW (lipid II flippase)
MISSVSVYSSFKVTSRMLADGRIEEANNYFYLLRNMIHVGMGIFAVAIVSKIDYTFFEKYAKRIFGTTLLFLFIVLFIGSKYNGAR